MSDAPALGLPAQTAASCTHCGLACAHGQSFCCLGCEAAFQIISGLGLDAYYRNRRLDEAQRAPRPSDPERFDLARCVVLRPDGAHEMTLTVDGVQCGACIWLIEQVLQREPGVQTARVNMTTCRLRLVWRGATGLAEHLVGVVERLGYRLVPFDAGRQQAASDATERGLIRALAVAGFAAGNVMLLSIGIWAGLTDGMGPATRSLLHWISALICLPAIAYCGMPFFRQAWSALRHGRTNMDVPISLGVVVVSGISLSETMQGGAHTYFDSAITLLFFLLIGRLLDHRARGQARATAERLLALRVADVAVVQADGTIARREQQGVAAGETVLVGMGERVGVDGVVATGEALLDTRLVTGESLPQTIQPGGLVFAGMVNLGDAITVRTTATGTGTLLAEMARLIEAAEGRRGRFVVLADRVARRYAPTVHICALVTFLWWVLVLHAPVSAALLTACAVLIITCPCALALAVPAAQVIATGALFHRAILLKSGTALERLAEIDTVVFDKTGTLSLPELGLLGVYDPSLLQRAAGLASCSRHPLARSLVAAASGSSPAQGVIEHAGQGLSLQTTDGEVRLGSRRFCGGETVADDAAELWFREPNLPPQRFIFAETLRSDAAATVAGLQAMGLDVRIMSGDRDAAVRRVAEALDIADWRAGCGPDGKVAQIDAWRAQGRRVLMVGDGLNDGPALASASVSISPSTAADLSQTVADLVFQGPCLAPVGTAIVLARRTRRVMRQNLGLAIAYNALVLPIAAAGYVTPWLAAAAMSLSSVMVMGNSLRLRGGNDA